MKTTDVLLGEEKYSMNLILKGKSPGKQGQEKEALGAQNNTT